MFYCNGCLYRLLVDSLQYTAPLVQRQSGVGGRLQLPSDPLGLTSGAMAAATGGGKGLTAAFGGMQVRLF